MQLAFSVFGLIIAFLMLSIMTIKGLHLSWVSLMAVLVIIFTSGLPLFDTWNNTIVAGMSTQAPTMIPLFLVGTGFGCILAVTGAADSFAKTLMGLTKNAPPPVRRIVACIVSIAFACLMSLAGITPYSILYAQIVVTSSLMKETGITRRHCPAMLILGSTLGNLLPGTASVGNIFAAQYLGTTATTYSGLAIVNVVVVLVLSLILLSRSWEKDVAEGKAFDYGPLPQVELSAQATPPWFFLLVPVAAVFVCFNALSFPALWSIVVGLVAAIVVLFKWLPVEASAKESENAFVNAFVGRLRTVVKQLNLGTRQGALPCLLLINMAFAKVIAAAPGYDAIVNWLSNLSGNVTLIFSIAVILIIGISISSSGLFLCLELAASTFVPMGVLPGVAQRMIFAAGTVLDTMPYGSMVCATLLQAGVSHKEGYPAIFKCTVLATAIGAAVVCLLAMLGIVF